MLVVSYNSNLQIRRLLETLAPQVDDRWEVIIADNSDREPAASDPTIRDHPQVTIHWTGGNIGYFPAAHSALQTLAMAGVVFDDYVVCNPDLALDPDFVERIRAVRESGHGDCIIAPRIRDAESGIELNPYRRRPAGVVRTLLVAVRGLLPVRMHARLAPRRRADDAPRNGSSIYAPHGSCLIIPREFLSRGGSVDYRRQLYGEEEFIATQAKQSAVPVHFHPSIGVTHHSHHATSVESDFVRRCRRRAQWGNLRQSLQEAVLAR